MVKGPGRPGTVTGEGPTETGEGPTEAEPTQGDIALPEPVAAWFRSSGRVWTGRLGQIHEGVDVSTGDFVTVTVVDAALAGTAEFIRRFPTDAARLAATREPGLLVPLRWWRRPSGTVLVEALVIGDRMADLMDDGSIDSATARAAVLAVGSALAALHRNGLCHGSLSAENVIIDADGHPYLTGLAPGLPPPASGAAADVAGLARLARELTAAGPGDTVTAARLRRVEALVGGMAPASVEELVPSLDLAIAGPAAGLSVAGGAPANPYPGMTGLCGAGPQALVGRDEAVDRVVGRLSQDGFAVVIGALGSGASSTVTCGVLPALAAGRAPGSDSWYQVTVRPSSHPADELVTALSQVAVVGEPRLRQLVTDRDLGGLDGVLADGGDLLVVVDPFEGWLGPDPDSRGTGEPTPIPGSPGPTPGPLGQELVSQMLSAATDGRSRLRLVAVAEADRLDELLADPVLGPFSAAGLVAIGPLGAAELREIVTAPARAAGVVLDDGLADLIVADALSAESPLPKLQFVLRELYDRREGHRLTTRAYRELGGVDGGIARRAEAVWAALSEDARAAAPALFSSLVEITADGQALLRAAGARRPPGGSDRAGDEVVRALSAAGLLTWQTDSETPALWLAHGCVTSAWPRLRDWTGGRRRSLGAARDLEQAASSWVRHGRPEHLLLAGPRLEEAEALLGLGDLESDGAAAELIEASKAAHPHPAQVEVTDSSHPARRRIPAGLEALPVGVGALVIAVVVAVIAAALLWSDRRSLRDDVDAADLEAATSAAADALEVDPSSGLRLAVDAADRSGLPADELSADLLSAMWKGLAGPRVLAAHDDAPVVAVSGDGELVALVEASGDVVLRRAGSGELDGALPQDALAAGGRVAQLGFSPNARNLAVASSGGRVTVVSLDGPRVRASLDGPVAPTGLAWSAAGDRLVVAGEDPDVRVGRSLTAGEVPTGRGGRVDVWEIDPLTGAERAVTPLTRRSVFGVPDTVATMSPGGELVANTARLPGLVTGPALVEIFSVPERGSVRDERLVVRIGPHPVEFTAVAWHPSSAILAAGHRDGSITVWDLRDVDPSLPFRFLTEPRLSIAAHGGAVTRLAWSDGPWLASGASDGSVRVSGTDPAAGGGEPIEVSGHLGAVGSVSLSDDGVVLASAAGEGSRLWTTDSAGDVQRVFPDPGQRVDRAMFSSDGERLVVSSDQRLAVWDLRDDTEALVVDDAAGESRLPDMGVAISDDGDLIASPVIRIVVPAIMDARTGAQLRLITGVDGPFDMAFVPGGHHLLVASRNGMLRLWDADQAGRPVAEAGGAGRFVDRLDITPDGSRAATVNNDGVIAVWSLPSLRSEAEFEGTRPPGAGSDVAIHPAGTLVARSTDAGVDVWDVETGQLVRRLTEHVGAVSALAFSPDGALLASAGADGRVVIWDVTGWRQRLVIGPHDGAINDVAFSPDGRWLATAGFDGTARVQLVDPTEIVALARARVAQATADAP